MFEPGETVFRLLPKFARQPKHLLGERATGPYLVVEQRTLSSVVLKDPKTNQLVDNGVNIPIDQILAGPRRSKVRFEPDEDSEVRGIGQMIRREGADLAGPRHRGLRNVGQRKGWTGLSKGAYIAYQTISQGPKARELTIAKVLKNRSAEQNALV